MSTFFKTISMGFALFAMFFGAGNLIFPLGIGKLALDKNIYAMAGLILTAVGVPFLGVAAMMLFNGNVNNFFNRLGRIPAFMVITIIMGLIGPFCAIPRCMLLSYSAITHTFGDISLIGYTLGAVVVLFVLTISQKRLVAILGAFLTPLLLIAITLFIVVGLIVPGQPIYTTQAPGELFNHGLLTGYQTLDLLAAFFFTSYVIGGKGASKKQGIWAASLGAFLLGSVYIGLSFVSAKHAPLLAGVEMDQYLPTLSMALLGPVGGIIAIATVALACLTTAITLCAVFADYLREKILVNKISYPVSLMITVLIAGVVSLVGFAKLVGFIAPLLQISYPALIILTILNICYKTKNFEPIKIPVVAAFLVGFFIYIH